MRHFFLFGPVTTLAFGVGKATSPAGLVAATGGTDGGASGMIGTPCGAVAVTAPETVIEIWVAYALLVKFLKTVDFALDGDHPASEGLEAWFRNFEERHFASSNGRCLQDAPGNGGDFLVKG